MARLPTPGSDNNTWGQILNDFLGVEHNTDGTLKPGGSLSNYATTDYVDDSLPSDASSSSKGIVQLTGDLGGSASSPTVPALVNKQQKFNYRGSVAGNTTYNSGDLLVYRGRRVLATQTFTTSAAPVTFISAANYLNLSPEHFFHAADFGSLTGNDANLAIQAALNEAYNLGLGATVLLPQGVFIVNATIDIPWGCSLEGAGKMSTVIQPLDGSNICPIRMHKSTGSGNANAMFSGIRNLGINGRKSTMTDSGSATHGIIIETNPITTAQTGTSGNHVEYFDPHHTIENVAIRSCLGDGLRLIGRGAHHLRDVWCQNNDGYGFYSTFDVTYTHCEAEGSGKAGFYINNGSQRLVGCKAYLNGRLNGDAGFEVTSGGSFASMVGCDAQNNGGPGYRVTGARSVNINGTSDGNGLLSYGYGATNAVELVNATGAIINVGAINSPQNSSEIGAQRYGLKMTGTTKSSVVMSNAAIAPATILGDLEPSSDLSGTNFVRINGVDLTANNTVFAAGTFGDGSAGSLIFDGATSISGVTLSAGTYTLGRDLHATVISVSSGVTIRMNGWRLFCQGSFTNNGTINADGTTATTFTGAAAHPGNSLGLSGAGGTGNTGAGSSATTINPFSAGGGGAGGSGSSGAGGSAQGTAYSALWPSFRSAQVGLTGVFVGYGISRVLGGGNGGSGGGGDSTNRGGGGGSGGGPIVIFARSFLNSSTGVLTAKGGDGAPGQGGNSGGGGGGGGGLVLVYTIAAWTQSGSIVVTAGSGGSASGTGTAGSSGTAGNSANLLVT